ncbi:LytR/AlgR family response regulator transcription factor [Schaalia suimastitidis]|uniref:LytR/AlgR family response regulator transcription factor n=1 Tax=Schaalia suimastitidis TaxID=121163 RepID=UPI000405831A|nr:LytTR family DNA-binding domain-containing protein [Schaalia suimastitidis]
MVHIGIVEDDPISRKLLLDYLVRFKTEHGEDFDVSVFDDGADIAANYRPVYDILFLDIQMERMDGLAAARHIRTQDEQVIIIFITSAPEYAIRGYEVRALSYLLKPLPWFAFEQELIRSLASVKQRRGASILVQSGMQFQRIPVDDIVYIESVKHRLDIHTINGVIAMAGTLKNMESELTDHPFYRSNSCYLVNLSRVEGVRDQCCIMTGNIELRISRPRLKPFLTALTQHVGARRV